MLRVLAGTVLLAVLAWQAVRIPAQTGGGRGQPDQIKMILEKALGMIKFVYAF